MRYMEKLVVRTNINLATGIERIQGSGSSRALLMYVLRGFVIITMPRNRDTVPVM